MNKVKSKLARFSPFFQSAMVVLIASLFVTSIVFAATTIGTNVSTGGNLTVTGTASSTSATSTAYLMVGVTPASFALFNHAGGDIYATDDLEVDGDANIGGNTTLVGTLGVTGATTLSSSLDVGGFASTTGDLIVSGGTLSLATGTATTTAGFFVGSTAGTGTTTVGIGDAGQNGCIELTNGGIWYYCMINGDGSGIQCAAGRCN